MDKTIKQLQHWFENAPDSNDIRKDMSVLGGLIGGHVVETVKFLEASDEPINHQIAQRLRHYAEKSLPGGSGKQAALSCYGWLSKALGNPTWNPERDLIVVELPTHLQLITYMKNNGAEYDKNEFFRSGFYRIVGATREQLYSINEMRGELNLSVYSFYLGGLWIYSTERSEAKRKEISSRLQNQSDLQSGILNGDPLEEMSELVDEIRENGQVFLCLAWDGGMPGMAGAVWVQELNGQYMVFSSDYDPQGPFESLDEALWCECFSSPTANAELTSEILSLDQLYDIAKGVADSENDGIVMINGEEHIFIEE